MGMIKLPPKSVAFFKEHQDEIFSTGNLAEGKWNKSIAEWASEYTGARCSQAVSSNGSGLFALLRLLKQYKGKKRIFLQSNTMYGVRTIAITSGLELCGYVDCGLDYLMPTWQQVDDFVSRLDKPQECVFLITHIGGWVNPDIERIADICREKGVSLIEDCAHSLGSLLGSGHAGLFGDAGVYSLYATKAIPGGEGGIIVTNNEELGNLVAKFVIYDRFDQKLDVGINIRMSELNALLVFSVIKETESIIANKYLIAEQYNDACDKYGWKYIHPLAKEQRSNLYKYILLSSADQPEDEFAQIKTRTSPVYDYALGRDNLGLRNRHICLPIWYMLDQDIVHQVLSELQR